MADPQPKSQSTGRMPDPKRREQPEHVTKEQSQNADMEQDIAQAQLPAIQQLGGVTFPGILLTLKPDQTTE